MKTCKQCQKEIIRTSPRANNVKFCSLLCRNRFNYQKNGGAEAQREYIYKKKYETMDKEKIQCQVCGKWYRKVGAHIVQVHKITAREYREKYGFDVKRGQYPEDLKEILREHVVENETIKNLKKGKKYWFKKGQEGVGKYKRSEQTMARLKQQSFIKKTI